MTQIPSNFGAGGKGLNPTHDTPNIADTPRDMADDFAAMNVRQKAIQAKLDTFIGHYNAHRAAAGVHVAADVDNPIGSPVATDPTADILTLVNDAAVSYEAHRVYVTDSVHGGADTTNVLTETSPATDETEAVALVNDVKAMYEAHRVLTAGSVHGAADSTNTIAAADATDWDSIVTLVNEIKNTTGFNAHCALVDSVHGAADAVNVITEPDAGTQITALYLEVNEFQTDVNAHIAHLGVHPTAGVADSTTTATTEATAVAMINGVKATFNTHSASADDHLDADTEAVAGTATEYEDIIVVVAEWKAAYEAHAAKSATHSKADAANAETALGTGGEVTIKTVKV